MSGYIKLQRHIWLDGDFVALTADAQRLYLVLISQPDLSHAGVVAFTPGRWSTLATDTTPAGIRAAVDELTAARFVAVDERTEELWVRSYMAHDGGYRTPNVHKPIRAALASIMSPTIREQAEHAAETLGVTLSGTLPETLSETLPATHTESQQPAAISHKPKTSSPQPQPQPDRNRSTPLDSGYMMSTNAAAAAAAWITHRINQPDVKHPQRLATHLRNTLHTEWGDRLDAHHQQHPDASVAQILWEVFNIKQKGTNQ